MEKNIEYLKIFDFVCNYYVSWCFILHVFDRNSEYDVVEPGHLETNMNQLHQEAYVPLGKKSSMFVLFQSLLFCVNAKFSETCGID